MKTPISNERNSNIAPQSWCGIVESNITPTINTALPSQWYIVCAKSLEDWRAGSVEVATGIFSVILKIKIFLVRNDIMPRVSGSQFKRSLASTLDDNRLSALTMRFIHHCFAKNLVPIFEFEN